MLVRAARHNAQRGHARHMQPAFEQLYLPWLCPAHLRYLKRLRKHSTVAPPSTVVGRAATHTETTGPGRPLGKRHLASAADRGGPSAFDEYIPFDHAPNPARATSFRQPPWLAGTSSSNLRDIRPSNLIILDGPLAQPPKKVKSVNGIPRDMEEIRLTIDACLRVGNLERAATLVARLNRVYAADAPELLEAHNAYLRAGVESIIRRKDQEILKVLQRWFELEMRLRGVEGDATTYALLLKASLQVAQGPKMERTVRRYMDLAFKANLRDEALSLPILSEGELGLISRICPLDFDDQYDEFVTEEPAARSLAHNHLGASDEVAVGDEPESVALPKVRSTAQKGLGLDTLRKSLASLLDSSPSTTSGDDNASSEYRAKSLAYSLQKRLEEDAISSAMERWRSESETLAKVGVNSVLQTIPVNAMMWEWHTALVRVLREEMQKTSDAPDPKSKTDGDVDRALYMPFLRLLPVETLAAVTILGVLNCSCSTLDGRGVRSSRMFISIGNNVYRESVAESMKHEGKRDVWHAATSDNRSDKLRKVFRKRQVSRMSPGRGPKSSSGVKLTGSISPNWPNGINARVGAYLISRLIDVAKITVTRTDPSTGAEVKEREPALSHGHDWRLGKRVGIITVHPELLKRLGKEPVPGLIAKYLPMVVEPSPWTKIDHGGFLKSRVMAVRIKEGDVHQLQYAKAAIDKGDMDQVFAGLDVLARTPWKINRRVFDVMLEAWNSGQGIASIAPDDPKIVRPPEPAPSDDPEVRKAWKRAVRLADNAITALHSQRCFQNFQLEIARAFLHETFYFPHNIDFRGRAYPIPPYFNHMGADNCRSLLMFAKGKELGEIGLRWLKVHLSNVFGFDKASFQERLDFAMEHLEDIYDSATNPLGGRRWWLGGEDPWQCLAACIELHSALESPDPTRYVSNLAIHQDGTCNGLQHYAALGGDTMGARQVNLEPGDRPSDIYTAVAEMIKQEVAEDAALGLPVAKVLEGKISRKVVKTTVMTNVYGVTYIGAKRQVRKHLKDIMPDFSGTEVLNHGTTSAYVASKIFKSLSTMFTGAHDIQHWLGECARRITQSLTSEQIQHLKRGGKGALPARERTDTLGYYAKDASHLNFRTTVIWTTPLKLPVVQPYRKLRLQKVETNLQIVYINEPASTDPVNVRKQLQAFPPNFIHSLDATHMLLSALKCDEVGLTFAAVHDSFWTHAADVDVMNRILRDAFIRMHSEDIVGRLAGEFAARYKGSMYRTSVYRRSALGVKIAAFRAALRNPHKQKGVRRDHEWDELLLECRRLDLLNSADPAEQEEGRRMVTPASMFADHADEKAVALPDDVFEDVAGIGDVPTRKAKLKANEQLEVGDLGNADPVEADVELDLTAAHDGIIDDVAEDPEDEPVGPSEAKQGTKKKKKQESKLYIWLPLTFPPVPKKGDFDVSRLKDSQYFFS